MGQSLQKEHFCIINKTMTVCWGGTVVKQLRVLDLQFHQPLVQVLPS